MNHIIHPNGHYQGYITVVPPRGHRLEFSVHENVVMLQYMKNNSWTLPGQRGVILQMKGWMAADMRHINNDTFENRQRIFNKE